MKSALYEGSVRHRRLAPVGNEFRYPLFQVFLDLSELETVFKGRWFWSTKGPNIAWFRRKDHLGDPAHPLDRSVRDLVEVETGGRPAGAIRLLTHLRYFGYGMNPVSFYYCFDATDKRVETIVAEIHNTPWGERHCYVLTESANEGAAGKKLFRFPKQFHVSPFMGMNQTYGWRFTDPGQQLAVHMENVERGGKIFDATLTLERKTIAGASLARMLLAYPPMTVKVIAAIYWQALRLWLRGAPFHPHPKHRAPKEARQ